jgi:hypothetical protein
MFTQNLLPDLPVMGAIEPPMIYVHTQPIWQYRQIIRDLTRESLLDEDSLNALGSDNWELVTVVIRGDEAVFYFKRPGD